MEISFTVVQYNTPTPTPQFFTGWMPFLPPNQQRQSTEGIACVVSKIKQCVSRLTRDVAPAPHSIVGSWEECSVHFLSAAVTTSSLHRVSHSSWLNLCLFIHGLSALWRRFEVVKRLTKMYSTTLKLSSMPSGLQCHKLVFCVLIYTHKETFWRLLFWDYPGELVREKNQSEFYWSKRQRVAVASARIYASLHLAADR